MWFSENLGNIIFVPAFEKYVKRIGYSVSLCRPRDPQSKGKVEEVIGYVKQSFLEGRVYTGIDSLNSAALAWLDREGKDPKNNNSLRLTLEIGVLCNNASMVRIKENRSFGKIASLVPRTEKWNLAEIRPKPLFLWPEQKGMYPGAAQ